MRARSETQTVWSIGGKAVAIQADLSKPDEIERLFGAVAAQFAKVDILVNNAGVYDFSPFSVEGRSDDIRRQCHGLLLATKSAVALMPAEGCVINICSNAADTAPAMTSIYAATKGAVNTITRVLALELAPKAIRVNAVAPGAVKTQGFGAIGNLPHEAEFVKLIPLVRLGVPKDIAGVVVFLASEDDRPGRA